MAEGRASLLVVDDDEFNRDMLSRRLLKKGFDVAVAPDGSVALEMIRAQSFDLVLLDVMMPLIDGMEVLETVRRTMSPTELPVIMATAKDKSEDLVAALELGANDYVTKPLDFQIVLARVHTQLALKRAMEQVRDLERNLAERNRKLEAANARMMKDLVTAARVQAALLPQSLPELAGVRFAWDFRPCDELAGDFLNVVPLGDSRVGLYVLDVSGHGVASALLSVSVARVLSPPGDPTSILGREGQPPVGPAEVANRLNRMFPYDTLTEQYFTLLYGVLDGRTREFRFVSAGHPGPVMVSARGEAQALDATGFPIGLAEDGYEELSLVLEPGDRLYLYSDGVPEALNPAGKMFGMPRILAAIRDHRTHPLEWSVATLRSDVEQYCGEAHVRDDVSILGVEMLDDEPQTESGGDDVKGPG